MIKARTLGRLGVVKERVERVRRAELADAANAHEEAVRAQNDVERVFEDLRNPLVTTGTKSAREHESLAALLSRAKADLIAAEATVRDRAAEREVRREIAAEAAREALSLERATERVAAREARTQQTNEEKTADDRATQRWRPS